VRLRAGVASDRGLVRQTNEDSFLVRRGLYAVCDGMGGARAGEVASLMACEGLLTLDPTSAGQQDLRSAIIEANRSIARRSLSEEHLLGMGTTLTAALAGEESLTIAHVGDSRAYLLREGELAQLTTDHSWVGEMVRRGELTPAQAAIHPHRSIITRALGTDSEVEPDVLEVPVKPGDRVLLCSDGLTGMVSDSDIAEALRRGEGPQEAAMSLVQAALAGGGEDNVTVVVVDFVAAGQPRAPDSTDELDDVDETADEVVVGPDDRGIVADVSSHRGRRSSAIVRERLGRRTGPFLPFARPVAARPAPGRPAVGSSTATALPPTPTVASAPGGGRARKWTRRKWIILALAVVLVIAVAVAGFAVFNSSVYYVGTLGGTVVLYRGLPGSVLGIDLSEVVDQGSVSYDSLAQHLQQRVDAHDLVSKEEGQLFLRTLSTQP